MATKKKPSPKQLAWRKKFAAMAKQRSRNAGSSKRNAGSSKRRPAAKRNAVTVRKNGHTLHGAAAQAVLRSRTAKTKRNPKRRRNAIGEVIAADVITRQVQKELAKQRGLGTRRNSTLLSGRKTKRCNPARRRNSAPAGIEALHKSFLGRPSIHTDVMKAPAGTPRDVAKLGDLVKLITETETFKFSVGEAILAANARGDLFVIGNVVIESNGNFGRIKQIEYKAVKNHLDARLVTYFHKFGEEGGKQPLLKTDGDGHFHIVGGDYTIEAEGITN